MDYSSGGHSRPVYGDPPPYSPYGNGPHAGISYNVGNGGIAVVSPSSHYTNSGFPDSSDPHRPWAPPEYSESAEEDFFSEASVRRGFIRKVYLTLLLQLLVTVGIICLFLYWDQLNRWTYHQPWFFYSMAITMPILILVLACCDGVRRTVPLNFIALGLFTLVEGAMLGSLAVFIATEAVLWAMGATALISFSLTLFSIQTKWDFTMASGSLWVFAWSLISFGLLCAIMRSQYLHILYACLATLLFSLVRNQRRRASQRFSIQSASLKDKKKLSKFIKTFFINAQLKFNTLTFFFFTDSKLL
ncbi:protein lifeguard 2 isoform X1 [Synchiropus splendidus]|uniref:protein lifeguard 2 isoform X1 n=1 Tax=Synchiropus splendidus TaxID=270530 RepID=UPI00237EAE24|nr:protein lifeguard 2 isoform X1 [Synchiropus splendidus]XP_053743514.1 protein lifeguard 2 isoform X1 [Synchiropus splendidus]XP_053743515.1 protein lifeguard 2 isoform X1 [Synchiropus splendidus]XP_053743516.1 protein lifeguard 2 isoform X1 [Synchiropus splendidus]XP_053743517.1 protein lifeguard 2 isoform X1 [Synchiropus splendidus]XP_053743518.1 protein lifeguard 2 isoform X1 [Synchiropus splendidus]XP_053743519.1 protein lifeguard 2 isoform X1 [Synchiropus splendidus]XP_053743520.1 pro